MLMKVHFTREIHNKIQIDPKKKNSERVQDRQQEMILKWNSIYDEL
jgi:hypothetical protein